MADSILTESILDSVKTNLGILSSYTQFDSDIAMYINSVFSVISQFGVGPSIPFHISSNAAVWSDFSEQVDILYLIRSYVFLKVKLIFDPPSSSSVLTAYTTVSQEYEWRLGIMAEEGGI